MKNHRVFFSTFSADRNAAQSCAHKCHPHLHPKIYFGSNRNRLHKCELRSIHYVLLEFGRRTEILCFASLWRLFCRPAMYPWPQNRSATLTNDQSATRKTKIKQSLRFRCGCEMRAKLVNSNQFAAGAFMRKKKNMKYNNERSGTWNISVFVSSLYSTIIAWFRDNVYDIECWFASSIAFEFWGDWTT